MKALLFNVNVPKFLILQALRPISRSFCYRGPFSTVKLADMPELIVTTLKGLRMPHRKFIMEIGCITGDVERVKV